MEDFWIGLGMVLALFGPLLLIPLVWITYRGVRFLLQRTGHDQTRPPRRALALAIAVALVAGALTVSYVPGRMDFDRLCKAHAQPVLIDSVSVDGFFRTHLYPYEAHQYFDNGFAFVEAPDPYDDGKLIRYSLRDDGSLFEEEVSSLESAYGVERRFETVRFGLNMTAKHIYSLDSGRMLASAYDMLYEGGPLSILLGVYGMSSCPDPRTATGSRRFGTFYNLEQRILRVSSPD